jgi:hypothetical protein
MTMTTTRAQLAVIAALAGLAPGCRRTGGHQTSPKVVAHRPVQEIQPPLAVIDPSRAGVTAPLACYSLPDKHAALGGVVQYLPTSDELDLADEKEGKLRRFVFTRATAGSCAAPDTLQASPVAAAIAWSPKTCAHLVRGAVLAAWERRGGPRSAFGYPITDELSTPDGGIRQVFEGGQAIWTPRGGVVFTAQPQP